MQTRTAKFHKNQIAAQFNRAANSYQTCANLQRQTGESLLTLLIKENLSPITILDLGCGTGYFTHVLSQIYPAAITIGIDIADKMLELIKPSSINAYKILSDFDALPVADAKVPLIFSNLALQWSLNLKETLLEWRRALSHNGYLIFSTLGSHSFSELKYCSQLTNYNLCINKLFSVNTVSNIIADCGFEKILFNSEILTLFFDDLFILLRHFKKIGANHAFNRNANAIMTKGCFAQLERNYQPLSFQDKLPLSYEIIYCLAKRV